MSSSEALWTAETSWKSKRVTEINIGFCRDCGVCQSGGICVIHDDVDGIFRKMRDADIIVVASPIYYFTISAPLKTLLERTFAFERDVQNK